MGKNHNLSNEIVAQIIVTQKAIGECLGITQPTVSRALRHAETDKCGGSHC